MMDQDLSADVARRLGARYPIFGFSHDWQVVAAMSAAGGVGILGTVRLSPDSLRRHLAEIEAKVGDAPYGVNLLVPAPGPSAAADGPAIESTEHERFVKETSSRLALHEVDASTGPSEIFSGGNMTTENALQLWEVCREAHPRVVSFGLGRPPAQLMDQARDMGALRVALAGSPRHAERLRQDGFDVIVAQSTEAAGHTGTIGGFVLLPEVVEAVAPAPVLAAGGIVRGDQMAAAEVLGAVGIWIGTALLTTTESQIPDVLKARLLAAESRDTYRTRALTGKPTRQLRNELLDAWEAPGAPTPLPSPHQGSLMEPLVLGGMASGDPKLMISPAGQGIGLLHQQESVAALVDRLIAGYREARERFTGRSSYAAR
jgi:NAD(P)H-dependent flavin oxidoreductase YrpB (nitropropane dioxygenase family)